MCRFLFLSRYDLDSKSDNLSKHVSCLFPLLYNQSVCSVMLS